MSILLSSYHLEFLASNGWKCNILIWNQLFLKEEGPFFTFLSKSHFWRFDFFSYFGLYFPFCDRQHGTFLYERTQIETGFWKKRVPPLHFRQKVIFDIFDFFPILAYISLSVIDNMVPLYRDTHIYTYNDTVLSSRPIFDNPICNEVIAPNIAIIRILFFHDNDTRSLLVT